MMVVLWWCLPSFQANCWVVAVEEDSYSNKQIHVIKRRSHLKSLDKLYITVKVIQMNTKENTFYIDSHQIPRLSPIYTNKHAIYNHHETTSSSKFISHKILQRHQRSQQNKTLIPPPSQTASKPGASAHPNDDTSAGARPNDPGAGNHCSPCGSSARQDNCGRPGCERWTGGV